MAEIRHGTVTGYNYYGCRCDRCREASTTYAREYRRKQRREYLISEYGHEPTAVEFREAENAKRARTAEQRDQDALDAWARWLEQNRAMLESIVIVVGDSNVGLAFL